MADIRPTSEPLVCRVCREPLKHLPRGWQEGDPTYCEHHDVLAGRDPSIVVPEALTAAMRDMAEPSFHLIDWCLPSITDAFGYLLPGTVTYACAFPKNGKTAFLSNNLAYWERLGVRVWVMPTESRPKGLMTRLACFRAGISPDEAMSRRLRVRMDSGDEHAAREHFRLMSEFKRMQAEVRADGTNIAIEPAPRLTRRVFRDSCSAAKVAGYGLVVVDHVDHIKGDPETGETGYLASENVQHDALEFAELFDMPVLLMSQLNTSRAKDPLHAYKRPVPDWLWMKGVKDQIATTMFGIYRPMRTDVDDRLMAGIKAGEIESWRIAKPHTMGLVDMLSRYNGAKRDRVLEVEYHDGIITDKPATEVLADEAERHGIWTGGPSERPRRAA